MHGYEQSPTDLCDVSLASQVFGLLDSSAMPRGGWRQRYSERSRSPVRPPHMSEQLRSWLMSWAWSGQSAAEVVRNAQAFVADGHRDPLIEELARAGGNVANAERAVRRVLPTTGPETIEVGGGGVTRTVPLGTMFRWVRDNHPEHFRSHFGASQACVRRFWEQLAGAPDGADFWAKHPFLRGRAPADLSHHVPLVMHDDVGPASKHNSAFVRSFHSILGVGRELESWRPVS